VARASSYGTVSDLARLVPGAGSAVRKKARSVGWDERLRPDTIRTVAGTWTAALPRFLKQFHPAMLGPALLDSVIVALIFRFLLQHQGVSAATLGFYFAGLAVFSVGEGVYDGSQRLHRNECLLVCKAVVCTTALTILALKCSTAPALLPILLFSWIVLCALCGRRELWRVIAAQPIRARNVLVVGSDAQAQHLAMKMHADANHAYSPKACLPPEWFQNDASIFANIARREFIDKVIVATHEPGLAAMAVIEARRNQLDVAVIPEIFGASGPDVNFENWDGTPLLTLRSQRSPDWALAIKRIADVVVAIIGLAVISPLMVAIAALIKLDSRGPVFYRALRVGQRGRRFTCFKFRTMVPHADALKNSLRSRNERDGAFFKISNDLRITRTGKFLRCFSLDELPQLWNVLRGEMSLVGPRPHPPDDVERYDLSQLQRLDFVPGITGLWQVTARQNPSFALSVALDVDYISNWSLGLDCRILWKTVGAVLHGSGA